MFYTTCNATVHRGENYAWRTAGGRHDRRHVSLSTNPAALRSIAIAVIYDKSCHFLVDHSDKVATSQVSKRCQLVLVSRALKMQV